MGRQPAMRTYNVFQRRESDAVLCAVPEDCVVPRFVISETWTWSGKLDVPAGMPVGFDEGAAQDGARLNGFYLFHAFARR
jgi:hypothetical protein